MRVELAGLTEAAGRFAHTYEPGELLLNDEQVVLAGPPTVSGRIIRSAGQVLRPGLLLLSASPGLAGRAPPSQSDGDGCWLR